MCHISGLVEISRPSPALYSSPQNHGSNQQLQHDFVSLQYALSPKRKAIGEQDSRQRPPICSLISLTAALEYENIQEARCAMHALR